MLVDTKCTLFSKLSSYHRRYSVPSRRRAPIVFAKPKEGVETDVGKSAFELLLRVGKLLEKEKKESHKPLLIFEIGELGLNCLDIFNFLLTWQSGPVKNVV